jgi:hypothetical protein
MAYCFDTSVLIECWSRSYPPDVFPGLWLKLDELIVQQEVLCPCRSIGQFFAEDGQLCVGEVPFAALSRRIVREHVSGGQSHFPCSGAARVGFG